MKAILLSIKPKYCELIASGLKTVEIRKTRPKIDTPFKCYIYCTKGDNPLVAPHLNCSKYDINKQNGRKKWKGSYGDSDYKYLNSKVIGEFVCDDIFEYDMVFDEYGVYDISDDELQETCLTNDELWKYGKDKTLYGWHISDLVIYDEPKDLDEFEKPCSRDCKNCKYWYSGSPIDYEPPCCEWEEYVIERPPQTWCYVENLEV